MDFTNFSAISPVKKVRKFCAPFFNQLRHLSLDLTPDGHNKGQSQYHSLNLGSESLLVRLTEEDFDPSMRLAMRKRE